MPVSRQSSVRFAFTVVEVTMALAVVAIVGVVIAQVIAISLRERSRSVSHQAALELAANALEMARAEPFQKLDADWAKAKSVPSVMADLLPDGTLDIAIAPDAQSPNAKLVTVEVRWRDLSDHPMRSVRLVTVVAPREAKSAGGAP